MFHRNRLKKYIKAGKGGLETYWSGWYWDYIEPDLRLRCNWTVIYPEKHLHRQNVTSHLSFSLRWLFQLLFNFYHQFCVKTKCFMPRRSVHILHHTLHRLILCIQIASPLLKYKTPTCPKAFSGKTGFPSDLSAYTRKWQIFGDFYTILSFSSFDIFGPCSNRYHFNTFCGKFGFRSRVKLSLRICVDNKIWQYFTLV